ncbi:hypothetical protein C9374_004097 [Naegleria lovaniensis]|uniref:Uncharacterized protein n=1 Tax=Naegleria lovaniensis TaxID=51637 RepID=A0AA88GQF7_NAELO|nr:uncharacterized protein C9374_004097 [Naegleria lovaniensis]KAG2383426.1 hypothetical protein C9374_004097 [Naegleria lovaniensis]
MKFSNNRSTHFILLSLTVISLVCFFLSSSSKATNTLSDILSTSDALTLSASSEGYVLSTSDEASTSGIALSFDEFNEMADEEIFGEDLNESNQNSEEEENNAEEEENSDQEENNEEESSSNQLEMTESGGSSEAQVASADTQSSAQLTQATSQNVEKEDEASASWLA